jgi:hypothetical protein
MMNVTATTCLVNGHCERYRHVYSFEILLKMVNMFKKPNVHRWGIAQSTGSNRIGVTPTPLSARR